MMLNRLYLPLILLCLLWVQACDMAETAKRRENLPKAKGAPGEILVVMDSAMWRGEIGSEIRQIFHDLVPGLPREEAMFNLNYVDPIDFKSILRTNRNLLFVTVLDDPGKGNRRLRATFTEESVSMINEDPSLFMLRKQDQYAQGQNVLHLFGATQGELLENLRNNREQLQQFFDEIERKRTYESLYGSRNEKGIERQLQEVHGCNLSIPYGYAIAMDHEAFIWIRNYSRDIDKSIIVAHVPYTHREQFSLDSLIAIRERVMRPYVLYKDDDPESYVVTETFHMDVEHREINLNGNYAVQLRGLWKLNKYTMGGPFIGYALVDQTNNRLYYIEGFFYGPGVAQREHMRELDTILRTFSFTAGQPG